MMTRTFLSTTISLALLATVAFSQDQQEEITDEEMTAADEAADVMFFQVYGAAPPSYMTASEAIDRMYEMGYSNVHDLDVEWGQYEVEAYAPDGNEVEIEFDPVTGAITDVSDNWF